jgi:hypothetical protein
VESEGSSIVEKFSYNKRAERVGPGQLHIGTLEVQGANLTFLGRRDLKSTVPRPPGLDAMLQRHAGEHGYHLTILVAVKSLPQCATDAVPLIGNPRSVVVDCAPLRSEPLLLSR